MVDLIGGESERIGEKNARVRVQAKPYVISISMCRGGGGACSFVACIRRLTILTTQPFRDGAPFLLVTETYISGCPSRFFSYSHKRINDLIL